MTIIDSGITAKTTKLTNEDVGSYTVTTASGSRYVVDLDNRKVTRHARDESDWFGDLRRNKGNGIINLVSCEVGQGMVIIIDEAVPGNKDEIGRTFTTSVVRIEKN